MAANLPAHHPSLTIHLADRARTPILSSTSASANPDRSAAVDELASTALAAYALAARLEPGAAPARVIVETDPHGGAGGGGGAAGGPVLFVSFLDPSSSSSSPIHHSPAAASAPRPRLPTIPSSGPATASPAAGASTGTSTGQHTPRCGEATSSPRPLPPAAPAAAAAEASINGTGAAAAAADVDDPAAAAAAAVAAASALTLADGGSGPRSSPRRPTRAELLDELVPLDGRGGLALQQQLSSAGSAAPLLVGLVLAPDAQRIGEARRALARVERVGRRFQEALAAEQQQQQQTGVAG